MDGLELPPGLRDLQREQAQIGVLAQHAAGGRQIVRQSLPYFTPTAAAHPHSGGRISTVGETGEAPVCVARWCGGRREILSPVMIAPPPTIRPRATRAAIISVSANIPRAPRYRRQAYREQGARGERVCLMAGGTLGNRDLLSHAHRGQSRVGRSATAGASNRN
jgi:hypothetical protein